MQALHRQRSFASSLARPNLFRSPSKLSPHVLLPLPLPLDPSTTTLLHFDTQSSLALRSTCPNHLNLPTVTTSVTNSIPRRCFRFSMLTLSFNFTPHIHLIIILSTLSSLLISSDLIAHVSLPYTITDCTQDLYKFPFIFKDAPLDVRMRASSLKFFHALRTLATDASFEPPPAPIISPK